MSKPGAVSLLKRETYLCILQLLEGVGRVLITLQKGEAGGEGGDVKRTKRIHSMID